MILAVATTTVNPKIVLHMRYKFLQALEILVQSNRLIDIIVLDEVSVNVSYREKQFQPDEKPENIENHPSNADSLMRESVFFWHQSQQSSIMRN
jgi:hypothetical protein